MVMLRLLLLLLLCRAAGIAAAAPAVAASLPTKHGGQQQQQEQQSNSWRRLRMPWMDRSDPPQTRASKLLKEMHVSEMIALLHGSCGGYTGNVCGNDRLGIPPLRMNDGPQGFRYMHKHATSQPACTAECACWTAGGQARRRLLSRPVSPSQPPGTHRLLACLEQRWGTNSTAREPTCS
jgi:hypothetical protein